MDRMRASVLRILVMTVALALPATALAQFGHPMKGQWSGEWGPKDKPNRVLLNLDWDGQAITGTINPGPSAATVKSVTFDYSNPVAWSVKIQAEAKDAASGKVVPITVDGKLENLGAYYKIFHGTWTQGGQRGDFTVTRN